MANRVKTLVKKARELEVLCDVPVCLLCFNPDGEFHSWPDNPQKLQSVLNRYQEAVSSPATRPSKKMKLDHSDEKGTTSTGYCDNGSELLRCIESKLEQLNQRITDLQQESQQGFDWVSAELEQGLDWGESEEGGGLGLDWDWVPEAELEDGGLGLGLEAELDLELGGFWYDMDQNKMIIY